MVRAEGRIFLENLTVVRMLRMSFQCHEALAPRDHEEVVEHLQELGIGLPPVGIAFERRASFIP